MVPMNHVSFVELVDTETQADLALQEMQDQYRFNRVRGSLQVAFFIKHGNRVQLNLSSPLCYQYCIVAIATL
jgi:hypothetical protein